MSDAWQPIESLDALLAAAGRHGLALQAEGATLDQTGLDFLVAHAVDERGQRWVVRTPRRAEVFASTAAEARALRLLRDRLPVGVPAWQLHHPDVIAYPRLPGTPVVTVTDEGPRWNVIDPAAPSPAFLDDAARLLAALQAIPAADADAAGLAATTTAEARQAIERAMLDTRDVLAPPAPLWERWQRFVADDALWPEGTAVSHGDIHPGHILIDDDGHITGILDWTEARRSDPSIDFAMFHGCFGAAVTDDLVARFTRAGGPAWPSLVTRAVERWSAMPALSAEWALRAGNQMALDWSRSLVAAAG